jgi:radical SAM protein with 4Fe4S-binding SPASM domain
VQVSVEGPGRVHDGVRGKGSYAKAMRGIGHLLDAGLVVTMNMTLSRLNSGYAEEMVAMARRIGVQRLGFSRLVPSGRGLGLLGEMLTSGEVKDLCERLLNVEVDGLDIVTGDPVASLVREGATGDSGCTAWGGCAAGISGLTFLPDGTINPCRRLQIPIGNIRADSLREVWATSDVLNALRDRDRYRGRCGRCARWASCRGCRAIAYAFSLAKGEADFLAEDPQCFARA